MTSNLSSCRRSAPHSPHTIEMIRSPYSSKTQPWLLIIGLSLLGIMSFFLGLRLWLITSIQAPLEGRLEYLMEWLGFSANLSSLTWMLTFGIGAFTAWPLLRMWVFFITGIRKFCPGTHECLLLLILPASTFLPATVQTICPIRELDPTSAAWFYPDTHPETGKPHGRIGYLREGDGSWKFYNIPVFIRPADAAAVQRVTPEVRQQWECDPQRQQQDAARQRRAADDLAEREAKLKLQREHEARMVATRLEVQRIEAQRFQSEKAQAEALNARQQAEQARQQADDAEQARREAETLAQQRQAALIAERSARERAEQAQENRRQNELSDFLDRHRQPVTTQRAVPTAQAFPVQPGQWRNIYVNGDNVEVWANGPIHLGADSGAPQTFPGTDAPVRFVRRSQVIHAMPASRVTTRVLIRKIQ